MKTNNSILDKDMDNSAIYYTQVLQDLITDKCIYDSLSTYNINDKDLDIVCTCSKCCKMVYQK